jgi:O-methyltransferase involved in polyketide biosynthesis
VLGVGLDAFACRNPHADLGWMVYEVDHPATQAHKRRLLQTTAIGMPPGTRFVPVDFATQTLQDFA